MGLMSLPRCRTMPVTPMNKTPVTSIQAMPLRLAAADPGAGAACDVRLTVMASGIAGRRSTQVTFSGRPRGAQPAQGGHAR